MRRYANHIQNNKIGISVYSFTGIFKSIIMKKLYTLLFFALVSICTMQTYGAVVYSTGFETADERNSWTIVNVDEEENDLSWKISQSFNAGYAAGVSTFWTFSTGDSWLISPQLFLSDRKYRLTFDLRIQYPETGSLNVTLGNSTDPTTHTTIVKSYTQATPGINPEKQELYFTPSSSENWHIAFHYLGNVGTLYIDNIEIEEVLDYDLAITKIEFTSQLLKPNENGNINVSVRNMGDIDQENVIIVVKNEQTQAVVKQENIASIASTETKTLLIPVSFTTTGLKEISITVSSSNEDQNPDNNTLTDELLVYSDFQGIGTNGLPYQINSKQDLIQLTYMVKYGDNFSSEYFVLNTDIDLESESGNNNGKGWLPIGGGEIAFEGNFDGKGHIIKNLFIDREGFVGFFGYAIGGVIKNLGIINADISGTESTGALIGACGSSVKNCYSTGKVRGFYQTGGLIGDVFDSGAGGCTIENCYSTCNMTIDRMISDYNASYTGGLIGYIYQATQVKNCYASGSIFVSNINLQKAVGGLIGGNNATITITSCVGANRLLSITPAYTITNIFGKIIGSFPSTTGVSNNYALDEMRALKEGVDQAFTTSAKNGTNKTIQELTSLNTYQTLGWTFGENENAPWKFVSGKLPKLWFEPGFPTVNEEIIVDRNVYIGSISCPGQNIDYLFAETAEETLWNQFGEYFSEQYKNLLPTESTSLNSVAYNNGNAVTFLSASEIAQAGDWKNIENIAPYFFPNIENVSQKQFNPLNYNITNYEVLLDGGYRVEDRSYTTEITYGYIDGVLTRIINSVANISRTNFYGSKLTGISSQTGTSITTSDNIRIYPNPATDYIYFSGLNENVSVKIIDLKGRILISSQKAESGINVSHLPSGLYFLQIDLQDGKIITEKLIKK